MEYIFFHFTHGESDVLRKRTETMVLAELRVVLWEWTPADKQSLSEGYKKVKTRWFIVADEFIR